jgi:anti-sigma B factor antagonist
MMSTTIDVLLWDKIITIVNIFGNLDYKNANALRLKINLVVRTSPKILVINMQNVDFIDSSGLGVLITILKAMRNES